MKIVRKYIAKYSTFGDTEKVVIAQYPNGSFYIHLGWMEDKERGTIIAGGYDSLENAEEMLMRFRPKARRIQEEEKQ